MAVYECMVCGKIFQRDEASEEAPECPACFAPAAMLQLRKDAPEAGALPEATGDGLPAGGTRHMEEIVKMAATGRPVIAAMGTNQPIPDWDQLLILGAQLDPFPLDEHAEVSTETMIGRRAERPMVLQNPVYISHMSFGALSRWAKIALSKGSAMAKTAMCSGEGGILPQEMDAAYRYIFEYVPNRYSVTPENLERVDAIEIKIGQGTKPGMGGHLPGHKVTAEIAAVRGKPEGRDIISPSKFDDIANRDDLKELVEQLRFASGGRPIGIKVAAGHIEKDLAVCVYAGADFVTIDGRGGATGASPQLIRDSTSVPTLYALARGRAYLDEHAPHISLVITGGLRVSSDFAKALALGADAVAVATAGLVAAGCRQHRICHSGNCPAGIATQEPRLQERFDADKAAQGVANYLNATLEELKTFARITGHCSVHGLCPGDLATTSRDIATYTAIPHV